MISGGTPLIIDGQNFPERSGIVGFPHPFVAVFPALGEHVEGGLAVAMARQRAADPRVPLIANLHEPVILLVHVAHDGSRHRLLITQRHEPKIQRQSIRRLTAKRLLVHAVEPVQQLGLNQFLLRAKSLGIRHFIKNAGDFFHGGGIIIMKHRREQLDRRVLGEAGWTPIAQPLIDDVLRVSLWVVGLGAGRILRRRGDVFDPLLHGAVVFPEHLHVAVVEIQIPRKLDGGAAPDRRSHAAKPLPRSEHERQSGRFVGMVKGIIHPLVKQGVGDRGSSAGADVLEIFPPEVLNVKIARRHFHPCARVAQPAALFALRAILGNAMHVAERGANGQRVQTVDLRVGAFKIPRQRQSGVGDEGFERVGIRRVLQPG